MSVAENLSTKERLSRSELFHLFDGIMLDAMNTIFVAKAGRIALYQELLGTLGINADIEEIEKVYWEKRKFFEEEAARARGRGEVGDTGIVLWSKINGAIIQELAPGQVENPIETGSWVYEEFLGNPRYFTVPQAMKEFLEKIHGRIRVIVASNQDKTKLDRFTSYFSLSGVIDNCFTSEEIGYEKPDPRFFQAVLAHTGLKSERILMVGNNIQNDIEGARSVGITTAVLLDWDNKAKDNEGFQRVTDPNQLLTMQFEELTEN